MLNLLNNIFQQVRTWKVHMLGLWTWFFLSRG